MDYVYDGVMDTECVDMYELHVCVDYNSGPENFADSAHSGNSSGSTSRTAGMSEKVHPKIIIEQIMLRKIPAFIISRMGSRPDANATMFGGVAVEKRKVT